MHQTHFTRKNSKIRLFTYERVAGLLQLSTPSSRQKISTFRELRGRERVAVDEKPSKQLRDRFGTQRLCLVGKPQFKGIWAEVRALMADSMSPDEGARRSSSVSAGTISKIRVENFMCHSNMEIEFGDYVNFITGQNGSGKSAILTALCVAFGCRARSTQRAATLKDFIKNGCDYAVVWVEMKNQGQDAYKPDLYGDAIIVERRIAKAASTVTIRDRDGRKIASGRETLLELVDHFNIDVENPCVVMTQDKSREFLHSGSSKDKFQFFFKATLLKQVEELLGNIKQLLESAYGLIGELERSIEPIVREINDLEQKIKAIEHVEEIAVQVKQLRKKLAWSHVYNDNKQLEDIKAKIEKYKKNVPLYEAKITKSTKMVEELQDCYKEKKSASDSLLEISSEISKRKDELQHSFSMASKERKQLEKEQERIRRSILTEQKRLQGLQKQVCDIQQEHLMSSQAESNERETELQELNDEIEKANSLLASLSEKEKELSEKLSIKKNLRREILEEVERKERMYKEISSNIADMQRNQSNKVTAFGGERVLQLLRVLERHHRRFRKPPIGPIGAHLNLVVNDVWAVAVENALGKLLNAFIVTDHKDFLLFKECCREAHYNYVPIYIYDFSRQRLNIPNHMLPQTHHPTVFSALHSDIDTVMNVLVDMGGIERQVLVHDYDAGKTITFGQRINNLKEVYTKDGSKMFCRNSVQTILPPMKRPRTRLCSSYADQIQQFQIDGSHMKEQIEEAQQKKRDAEDVLRDVESELQTLKRRRLNVARELESKNLKHQDLKKSIVAASASVSAPSTDDLQGDIARVRNKIIELEEMLEKIIEHTKDAEAKVETLKESFEKLQESAKSEIDAMNKVTEELEGIQQQILNAQQFKAEKELMLNEKLLPAIKENEEEYRMLEKKMEENRRKASYVCPESEIESLGGCSESRPDQLSAQLVTLNRRLEREENRVSSDSLGDLRAQYEDKQKRIKRKQRTYEGFRYKLLACKEALDLREATFRRTASLLKRQLTWRFNGHLGKKGISGKVEVDYEKKTLSLEVKMPQDGSSTAVRDTRGLSGGERSFSTLCFTLALHEMTESPFRAMDEFDVFMVIQPFAFCSSPCLERCCEQENQLGFLSGFCTIIWISMLCKTRRQSEEAADGRSSTLGVGVSLNYLP
ncbi:hypothetical protein V2J09_011608 [Rumex salicifolius]